MRLLARSLVGVVLVALAMGEIATAQSGDPAAGVAAVVSPDATPACTDSGLGTFLVPTVGEVVGPATGPVLVMCGSRSATEGTRCELTDSAVAVVWPAKLSGAGVPPPAPGGTVVDATSDVAGVEPGSLAEVLQCSAPVPSGGGAAPAPQPAAAAPATRPVTPAPSLGSPAPAVRLASPNAAPAPIPTAAPSAASSPVLPAPGVEIAAVRRDGKGALLALLALGLAAALWRHAQRPHDRRATTIT